MARIVITFGLVAGALMAGVQWLVATLCVRGAVTFDQTTLIGYAGTVLALSIIFLGIRSYRDNDGGGSISFWKAVQVGLLMTLIASIVHAIGFELYNFLNPEFKSLFLEKFTEYKMAQLAQPPSPEAVEAVNREVAIVRTVHENPLLDFIVSLVAILPVGVVVTLLSAALLRRKELLRADLEA